MRTDPTTLLRGLAKFVAVVVVAGLVGAGVGIGLAKLSGNDGDGAAAATETTPASGSSDLQRPRIDVLSALLGRVSLSTGRALVAVRVRITNHGGRSLTVGDPILLTGQDEVSPNPATTAGRADRVPRTLAAGASATGVVRFTLSRELAERLTASPTARLRIANRIVTLNLTRG